MRHITALLLLTALVGCIATANTWIHKPNNKGVIFVYVETAEKIQEGWETATGNRKKVDGWARWYPGSNICMIHVPPLNSEHNVKIWRHELRHCQDGHFHTKTVGDSRINNEKISAFP